MRAYYNEHDKFAAAWLRALIEKGLIANGDVDTRDIRDVRPDDLRGYTQCHFFAGIGVWSYALRRAGWPDERPVWTGSCPCQPFSAAGAGGGFADERHLWPHWHYLIQQRKPGVVFGEQVASKNGLAWLDLVQTDMEATDYAFGAIDLCAAGVGAPHIRQRHFFVADAADTGQQRRRSSEAGDGRTPPRIELERLRYVGGMAVADSRQRVGLSGGEGRERDRTSTGRQQGDSELKRRGAASSVAYTDDDRLQRRTVEAVFGTGRRDEGYAVGRRNSPLAGHWLECDWLDCTDGKARPVEPGTFPLAHGAPARMGRLRGYGNAIVADVATEFIKAYLAHEADQRLRLAGGVFA